jgi:membrane-associated protease RseP (regulator of RpoE activity)
LVGRPAAVGGFLAALLLAGGTVFLFTRPSGPVAPPPRKARQVGEHHWIVPREDRDAYLGEPARVNAHLLLKPEPGAEAGSVARLTVVHVSAEGPMHAAGWRQGDVVRSVNGREVTTMERALGLLQEARTSPRLTAQIERDGRRFEFRVDFE